MPELVGELNSVDGLAVDLIPVDNRFFGPGITVSGLLTGEDVLAALDGGAWDLVCLPPNCVNGEGLTLDDMTVAEIGRRSGLRITVGRNELESTVRSFLVEDDAGTTPPPLRQEGEGRQLSELGYFLGRKGS